MRLKSFLKIHLIFTKKVNLNFYKIPYFQNAIKNNKIKND
jgi:hypothetical protein